MRVRTCHACIHSNPCQEIMIKREIFRPRRKVIHLFVVVLSRWCWQSAQVRLLKANDENLGCLFSRFLCEKQGLTIFPHCRILISSSCRVLCNNHIITPPQIITRPCMCDSPFSTHVRPASHSKDVFLALSAFLLGADLGLGTKVD